MTGKKRIGLREVRALPAGGTLWDSAVPAFGIRRQNSEAVAYVLLYRTKEGRLRRFTIGRHGAPWTPDSARDEAKRILGEVSEGKDPATNKQQDRKADTMADLCDQYLREAESGRLLTRRKVPKKNSTLLADKGRIERHIKPMLGRLKVAAVTRQDVEYFMSAVAEGKTATKQKSGNKRGLAIVKGGKTAASRTVGLLGAIFTYAIRHHMRTDNPVHGVTKYADGKRERRLSDHEYGLLGTALQKSEQAMIWPAAIAAARFMVLTGWRRGEVLNLRWREVDSARRTATLADTKTGRSVRPLSHAACDVLLRTMTRGKDDDLVFPATRGSGAMIGFPKLWAKMVKLGAVPADITPHVLRHSYASLAGDLGYSEPTIAALVGHKGHSITSRYMHAADAVLLAAADAVANRTAELMGMSMPTADVVPFRR